MASRDVQLQETLYASRNPTRRWLHCARRDWITGALARCAGPGGRALEVGPGSGVYVPTLLALFDEVTVADVETAHLEHIRAKYPAAAGLTIVRDDITRSRLPGDHYDLVLCSEVIEHLADSPAALREMHRLLRPGGRLVLSTPQRWSTLEVTARVALLPGVIRLVRLIYGEPVEETGHINLLTRAQAEAQIAAAGLTVLERHLGGLYLPLVAELFGEAGLRLERWAEERIRDTRLDFLLWTQFYVLEKAPPAAGRANTGQGSRIGEGAATSRC